MEKSLKISNIKGLLIFLVVFGHFIELNKFNNYEIFNFMYAFHMPLFIFISGYLAKKMKISKIVNLILLYLVFQTIFNFYKYLLGFYETFPFHYGTPQFQLWYIVSLGIWYTIAFVILKLKLNKIGKWIVFTIIMFISFISRWYTYEIIDFVQEYIFDGFNSFVLSYQRTITFAPFFFAGLLIEEKVFHKLSKVFYNKSFKVFGSLFILLVIIIGIENITEIEKIFRGSYGVSVFLEEKDLVTYMWVILAHYVIATILSLLILNWVSNKNMILSRWGDSSLTIFLFHPIFIFLVQKYETLSFFNPNTQIAISIIISTLVCYLLTSNIFVKLTKPLCNPLTLFLKKDKTN